MTAATHTLHAPAIRLKRVYEEADEHDGVRVLVDRLWPRGISKDAAHLDAWMKNLDLPTNCVPGSATERIDGTPFASGTKKNCAHHSDTCCSVNSSQSPAGRRLSVSCMARTTRARTKP
jgi:hypothetical protein